MAIHKPAVGITLTVANFFNVICRRRFQFIRHNKAECAMWVRVKLSKKGDNKDYKVVIIHPGTELSCHMIYVLEQINVINVI